MVDVASRLEHVCASLTAADFAGLVWRIAEVTVKYESLNQRAIQVDRDPTRRPSDPQRL
jgi:hypothetical protein